MEIAVIGLNLAKHVFQVHGVDVAGRACAACAPAIAAATPRRTYCPAWHSG